MQEIQNTLNPETAKHEPVLPCFKIAHSPTLIAPIPFSNSVLGSEMKSSIPEVNTIIFGKIADTTNLHQAKIESCDVVVFPELKRTEMRFKKVFSDVSVLAALQKKYNFSPEFIEISTQKKGEPVFLRKGNGLELKIAVNYLSNIEEKIHQVLKLNRQPNDPRSNLEKFTDSKIAEAIIKRRFDGCEKEIKSLNSYTYLDAMRSGSTAEQNFIKKMLVNAKALILNFQRNELAHNFNSKLLYLITVDPEKSFKVALDTLNSEKNSDTSNHKVKELVTVFELLAFASIDNQVFARKIASVSALLNKTLEQALRASEPLRKHNSYAEAWGYVYDICVLAEQLSISDEQLTKVFVKEALSAFMKTINQDLSSFFERAIIDNDFEQAKKILEEERRQYKILPVSDFLLRDIKSDNEPTSEEVLNTANISKNNSITKLTEYKDLLMQINDHQQVLNYLSGDQKAHIPKKFLNIVFIKKIGAAIDSGNLPAIAEIVRSANEHEIEEGQIKVMLGEFCQYFSDYLMNEATYFLNLLDSSINKFSENIKNQSAEDLLQVSNDLKRLQSIYSEVQDNFNTVSLFTKSIAPGIEKLFLDFKNDSRVAFGLFSKKLSKHTRTFVERNKRTPEFPNTASDRIELVNETEKLSRLIGRGWLCDPVVKSGLRAISAK